MGVQYSPSAAATTRGTTSNSLLRPDQNHSEEDESMHSDDDIHNYGKCHIILIRYLNENVQTFSIKLVKIKEVSKSILNMYLIRYPRYQNLTYPDDKENENIIETLDFVFV